MQVLGTRSRCLITKSQCSQLNLISNCTSDSLVNGTKIYGSVFGVTVNARFPLSPSLLIRRDRCYKKCNKKIGVSYLPSCLLVPQCSLMNEIPD